jgi:hypothetical protein
MTFYYTVKYELITSDLQIATFWNCYYKSDLFTKNTCQQRPLFLSPKNGRRTQVIQSVSANRWIFDKARLRTAFLNRRKEEGNTDYYGLQKDCLFGSRVQN